jgi:DNA-directed RNA polymerase specialized sigma24 family protein
MEKDNMELFEQFIDSHCPSIFSAIARLTGLSEEKEIETITLHVLIDLWKRKYELSMEAQPKTLIYKILLQQIFVYLKMQGNEDRILLLRKTVLIDPIHYLHILEPVVKPKNRSFKATVLRKLRRILDII